MSGAAIRSERGWEHGSIPQVLAGPAAGQLPAGDAAQLLASVWAQVGGPRACRRTEEEETGLWGPRPERGWLALSKELFDLMEMLLLSLPTVAYSDAEACSLPS